MYLLFLSSEIFKYNYLIIVNMSLEKNIDDPHFIEEELFQTKKALFAAKSVKELKFLQNKLNYLMKRIKEIKKEDKL